MSGQRPGESDKEYMQRLNREMREKQARERDERIAERLELEAQAERDAKMDRAIEREFEQLLGGSLDDLRAGIDAEGTDWSKNKRFQEDMAKAIKDLQKGNVQGANKKFKKHKSNVRKAVEAGKKQKGGCAIVALLLIVVAVAMLGGGGYALVALAL